MDSLVIVDCQYDFIDGTLACKHSHEAVEAIIHFLNTHEVKALYTSDWHRPSNQSFKRNGGIWPDHCVQGTKGAELDSEGICTRESCARRKIQLRKKAADDKVEKAKSM